jgi:hypothetical protein
MSGIPGFIFDAARARLAANTLDPSTATLYVRLLLGIPAITMAEVSDANIFESAGFQYLTVTGWDGALLEASPVLFSALNSDGDRVRGFLVCEQAGSSPEPDDPLVCFGILRGPNNLVLSPEFVGESLRIPFPDGVFSIEDGYVYYAPDYASGNIDTQTIGIFHLLGSENYTKTYANPGVTSGSFKYRNMQGNGSLNTAAWATAKQASNVDLFSAGFMALDFKSHTGIQRRVRPGKYLFSRNQAISSQTIQIHGSNTLPALNATNIQDDQFWTLIGENTGAVANQFGLPSFPAIVCNSPLYWAYLRIKSINDGNGSVNAILTHEFFDSYILSPNEDLLN